MALQAHDSWASVLSRPFTEYEEGEAAKVLCFITDQGKRVVQKPVNVNPGLKVNRSIDFSCIKLIFTAYVLCSLSLVKLKTEGRTV